MSSANPSNSPAQRLPLKQEPGLILRRSAGGHGLVAELTASNAEVQLLKQQIELMQEFPDYDQDPALFELASEALVARFAPKLTRQIRLLATAVGQMPTLLIVRGLELSNAPAPTPIDGVVRQKDVAPELVMVSAVMRHVGLAAVAYASENDGRLVRAVCPVKKVSDVASSQGAAADLTDHADNGGFAIGGAFDLHTVPFPEMNSHQFFATITPEPNVPMRIKLNEDVFARFDPRGGDPTKLPQYGRLFEGIYRFATAPSHGEVVWFENLPVLVRFDDPDKQPAMRLHCGSTEAMTPEGAESLELLKHAIRNTPEEVIYTRRGDVIGYLNQGATHRREPFEARFDGTDRYYLRVYGLPVSHVERWASSMTRNGRVM